MNQFKASWLRFWRRHKTSAYLCISICMGLFGFALLGSLGLLMYASLSWLNGQPLNYGMVFIFGFCGAGLFALSVYVKNPLITILDCLEKKGDETHGNRV